MDITLFPFNEYWWFYLGFIGFIAMILVLDLGVFHKKSHEVSFKEAGAWTTVWICLALAFNYLFYEYSLWKFSSDPRFTSLPDFNAALMAKQSAMEFLTGFVVEKSLAIDNIFVFAIVFSYFGIPAKYQHRILVYGIIGALVFRAIFIALGSYLMSYHAVVLFFGVFLIITGVKMFFTPEKPIELDKNPVMKLLNKIFRTQHQIEGERFFVRREGLLYATPLFVALMVIEFSDLIFAVDSVPAIFALTKEPLIVFTSNIFAILGLRSMYFMISGFMHKFVYIKYGLASVLVFVGLKMSYLNEAFNGKFPISWSLGIIALLIGGSMLASVVKDRFQPSADKPSKT